LAEDTDSTFEWISGERRTTTTDPPDTRPSRRERVVDFAAHAKDARARKVLFSHIPTPTGDAGEGSAALALHAIPEAAGDLAANAGAVCIAPSQNANGPT
jgi:hypothetical protein